MASAPTVFIQRVFKNSFSSSTSIRHRNRWIMILSFTYSVSGFYPFLSGPLAPSSRPHPPKIRFTPNRVSTGFLGSFVGAGATRTYGQGKSSGCTGQAFFNFRAGVMWGRGGAGGVTRSGTGERENGPKKPYRKKVFFFFSKEKGQKAKIRKNTLGNKQTKGKRTNNCHDHLFKAKCTN